MTNVRTLLVGLIWCGLLGGAVAGRATMAPATPVAQATAPAAGPEAAFADDVHQKAGLTCESCHGEKRPDGAYPAIARTAVAPLCAKCHADAAYMRTFAPQVRVDQYAQYQTSVHGQQMAKGESRVATCSDCHGSHGVVPVRDTRSPVAPARVAQTCATCHADEARMSPFNRSHEVYADWSESVHATALLKRGDGSAPTCSTCHGSHGATPPGVDSVANICAQCHVREADLFKASPKKAVFAAMGQSDCLTCHSNHKILSPTAAWIGFDEKAVCATCHDETMPGAAVIKSTRAGFDDLQSRMQAAETVLHRAETAGMLVDTGKLALHAAGEAHVRMRVAVHAFAPAPFDEILKEGLGKVEEARTAGESALSELQYRRGGLAIATLVILGFLGTLFVKIRSLPPIP
jgi:predicted CXXCH cytochrome family protein